VSKQCSRTWRLTLPLLLLAGCDLPGRPDPAERLQVKDFGALYATHCAGCHGADGKLGPAPPLNDPMYLAIVPDKELLRVITEGRAVTPTQKSPMPAFARQRGGPLTDEEVQVLAAGIKKRWKPLKAEERSLPPYLATAKQQSGMLSRPGDGERQAPAQVGREGMARTGSAGSQVFARACASCHGSDGQGGKDGERHVGAISDPAFLALISDQALRRYVITGRPDLGMPSFDDKHGRPAEFQRLSPEEIGDLVAFLASWRKAGGTTSNE
jgi:cytochrome c oxidase cbb3-type subunit III